MIEKTACISRQSEIVLLQLMMLYVQPLAALSWGRPPYCPVRSNIRARTNYLLAC